MASQHVGEDSLNLTTSAYRSLVSMTAAIWDERCPGIYITQADLAIYEQAARAALAILGLELPYAALTLDAVEAALDEREILSGA